MKCCDCKASTHLHAVAVGDLSTVPPNTSGKETKLLLCESCLKSRNFWCDTHGPHKIIWQPDETKSAHDLTGSLSTCLQCCTDEVLNMDQERIARLGSMLRSGMEAVAIREIEANQQLPFEDTERKLLFTLLVTAHMLNLDTHQAMRELMIE